MSRKMKDSGIVWIGEIPEEAQLVQLRYIANICTGDSDTQDNEVDGQYPFYVRSPIVERSNKYSFDDIEAILMAGDGVGAGRVFHYVKGKYACHQRVYRMSHFKYTVSKFLKYYIPCMFPIVMDQGSAKSTVDSVRLPMLKGLWVVIHDIEEQPLISNYLDTRCSLIDQTIEKQKQVIEKLKEYKQSVITELVTKGLDPNVSMKDSGIEWIGEIPAHWDIKQLSSLFCERKYKNRGNTEINVLSLSYGNIKKRNVETNMGLLPESFETYNVIEPGNIVLRLTDLQNDHKSLRCGLVKENGIITSAYVTLEKKNEISEINTEYFYRLLHMFDIKKGFYGMGDGVRQNLKFNGELNKLPIVIPTVTEQNEIVNFLNERCEAIDKTVEIKEIGIQKLEEYKKSLIYECVTGKREVK